MRNEEKSKRKICPKLSRMFYIDVAHSFGDQQQEGAVTHSPTYEIRTVTWHCEKDKCQLWIPEFSVQAVTVVEGKKAKDTKFFPKAAEETVRGWCGLTSEPRGPAS